MDEKKCVNIFEAPPIKLQGDGETDLLGQSDINRERERENKYHNNMDETREEKGEKGGLSTGAEVTKRAASGRRKRRRKVEEKEKEGLLLSILCH